ncbi:uncharacterized protein LOC134182620 [Corticium candelabrum]|uniref:uncharacterized protein LOC134182620 n=1 Tax=Corticium candelabrum TaxID=121492 RepID=UPI002E26E53A|nr:uncharacterized protein LOC134182620 [Corticium candelabrum]
MISFKFDRRYYSGQEKRSLPHGYGVYQSPFDDFRYEGKWNGVEMQDVEGKLFWKNGSLYQGSFKHGQISGEGFKKCVETRTEYRGGFELGLKHGEGLVLYSDGSWYDGPWQNDKREGIGMWTSLDENEEYHGHFLNDYRDGEGSCRYSNGDKYEGQWTRGLRDGKGTMWHTSGIVYKGLWTNDKPSDRPLAIKIKTESHIEVSSNEHEITLIVDCVRKDGGVSYSESDRILKMTAGKVVKKKTQENHDTFHTPWNLFVEPIDIKDPHSTEDPTVTSETASKVKNSVTSNATPNLPDIEVHTPTPPPRVATNSKLAQPTTIPSTVNEADPQTNPDRSRPHSRLHVPSTHHKKRLTYKERPPSTDNAGTRWRDAVTFVSQQQLKLAHNLTQAQVQGVTMSTVEGSATFSGQFIPTLKLPLELQQNSSPGVERMEGDQKLGDVYTEKGNGRAASPSKISDVVSSEPTTRQQYPKKGILKRPKTQEKSRPLSPAKNATIMEAAGKTYGRHLTEPGKTADVFKSHNLKPGDCVLMVCDITEPNFFGPPLDPDYIPLKLLFPKKSKGNRFKPQKTRSVTHGKHTSPNA